jgi:hypothetical protein
MISNKDATNTFDEDTFLNKWENWMSTCRRIRLSSQTKIKAGVWLK